MNKTPSNLVKAVDRSINILEELANHQDGLGVTALANRLDIHKSSVHRLLSTLVYRGLVKQDSKTDNYKLGLKLFELGSRIFNELEIREYAKPYLEELVAETDEAVHLVIMDQGEIVYIDKVESSKAIRMNSQIGKRVPVHCSAVGKAMLAYYPELKVDQIIKEQGLAKYTENTITDASEFKEHLKQVKEQGYAIDDVEHELGIRCVAAPIFDYSGEVVSSVSVSGPTIHVTKQRVEQLAKLVKDTAMKISSQLGYRG
ncbi:IclR family transcriptional regulator [Orenia metallireducens]|jgi:DNA-binding IclR family transcriptional regulator|uniref:Glycerol operon regulatory protein n=1 Tax=Orenia metallireducens TaxID=1413210 RepID=A0A285GC04_9FIRM|nr:IclR family transcriptional regulator [Orenia metallireducens]PRX32484.1 IclR family transcriptional regulator [Orenia metallireducens]SNY21112.1 transcriptional regulator, IclR family [Orenia metallireducens]